MTALGCRMPPTSMLFFSTIKSLSTSVWRDNAGLLPHAWTIVILPLCLATRRGPIPLPHPWSLEDTKWYHQPFTLADSLSSPWALWFLADSFSTVCHIHSCPIPGSLSPSPTQRPCSRSSKIVMKTVHGFCNPRSTKTLWLMWNICFMWFVVFSLLNQDNSQSQQ